MKTTLSTEQAISILLDDRYANWSYNGARAIIEFLQDLEEDLGEVFELDRTALRCEYAEYETLAEWAQDHNLTESDMLANKDEDERDEEIREYIRNRATLIEFDGGIVVSCC